MYFFSPLHGEIKREVKEVQRERKKISERKERVGNKIGRDERERMKRELYR